MNNETNINPNGESNQTVVMPTAPATSAVQVVNPLPSPSTTVQEMAMPPVTAPVVAQSNVVTTTQSQNEPSAIIPTTEVPTTPTISNPLPTTNNFTVPTAQPAATNVVATTIPSTETPVQAASIPAIETHPPLQVASNNFADFQMPETPTTPPVTVTTPPVVTPDSASNEIVGESKNVNKLLYIILGVIIGVIIIVGVIGFIMSKTSSKSTPNSGKIIYHDILCSYDSVIRTINIHSEAVIRLDSDGSVSKVDYTHTYSASDQSALNDKHLEAIEYCKTSGAETKLGKNTQCELKDGKIIITAYLDGEADKPAKDYKTALTVEGFTCN